MLQPYTHQWLGTFSGPGNGDYRAELRHALQAITVYATACVLPLTHVIVRVDGLYGNTAPVTEILSSQCGVIGRSKEYTWLDLPAVQARLQSPPDVQVTHPASGTVRDLYDCFKALDTAVKWNLIARNVCDLVSPPHAAGFEIKPLDAEQAQQLLMAARGHPQEALFVLALATGMRRGELLALKWQDINFTTGTLQIRRILTRFPGKGFVEAEPKTQKSRRNIVVAAFALEALKRHRKRQLEAKLKAGAAWQDHDYVFCTSIGTHLNPSKDALEVLKKLLQQAGLPDIRFHDLRHSAATLLLNEGVHPKIVQELLGHSNISMTMDVYSHVLPSMQQGAISRLNSVLGTYDEEGDERAQA